MATNRQASKRPKSVAPDAKSATRTALGNIADYAERLMTHEAMFGLTPNRRTTKEEWAAFEEARRLAVGYIRTGAKG